MERITLKDFVKQMGYSGGEVGKIISIGEETKVTKLYNIDALKKYVSEKGDWFIYNVEAYIETPNSHESDSMFLNARLCVYIEER